MRNFYTAFSTNLPIPIKVGFGSTNKYEEIETLHTTKDIRIGVSHVKYGFPGRLNFMLIAYCSEGKYNYITENGSYEINEGECLIIGRRLVRYSDKNNITPHSTYTISFDHEFCKNLGIDDTITCLVKKDDVFVKSCVLDIIKAIDKKEASWENKAMDIVKSLLLHINENYGQYAFSINDDDIFNDETMNKLDGYIRKHISEKITRDDMAEAVGLKSSQFNKRFKATTGYTPTEYLNIKRCAEARGLLLTTDFSIEDVVAMCGYNDKSYFYKKYKEIYGTNAYDDANLPLVETFYKLKTKK